MSEALYEPFHNTSPLGISFAWHTSSGGYHPLHWHDEIEILYPLSGKADIVIDNVRYNLPKRHLLVVESGQIHSSRSNDSHSMFLCIHMSKARLRDYMPEIDTLRIQCLPEDISDVKFQHYLRLCQGLDHLTRLYIKETPTFYLEADGIILQIMAKLIKYFSVPASHAFYSPDTLSVQRMQKIISFVEKHFGEPISLAEAASLLGIGREYFCRFFKENMGISFFQYVNEIRISHVYNDLLHTDLPILEIMERNGFTNQKLFNRNFKELYGCTPSETRKRPERS